MSVELEFCPLKEDILKLADFIDGYMDIIYLCKPFIVDLHFNIGSLRFNGTYEAWGEFLSKYGQLAVDEFGAVDFSNKSIATASFGWWQYKTSRHFDLSSDEYLKQIKSKNKQKAAFLRKVAELI